MTFAIQSAVQTNNIRSYLVCQKRTYLYEIKNIVEKRQKMCYTLKRAIVLQGALTSF